MITNKMPIPKKRLTQGQAIKFYCRYSCCANDNVSWRNCLVKDCALYPYRMGKRPLKNKDEDEKEDQE